MVRLSTGSVNGHKVIDKKDRSCQESHQRHWIVQVLSTERGERGVGNPTSVRSSPFYNTSSHQLLTNPTSRQCVVRSSPFYNTSSNQLLTNPTSRQCVVRSSPFYHTTSHQLLTNPTSRQSAVPVQRSETLNT